eukprot:GILI01002622.1.p1 GENE.GILI01002622.1~~GILI01002622.1.p1  ORF type:complete len:184 (-),score=25.36 GILI01002622.1:98-649(-)
MDSQSEFVMVSPVRPAVHEDCDCLFDSDSCSEAQLSVATTNGISAATSTPTANSFANTGELHPADGPAIFYKDASWNADQDDKSDELFGGELRNVKIAVAACIPTLLKASGAAIGFAATLFEVSAPNNAAYSTFVPTVQWGEQGTVSFQSLSSNVSSPLISPTQQPSLPKQQDSYDFSFPEEK